MRARSRSSHQRCSVKKGVLSNSQNSQENTSARASLLIKLQAPPATLLKKRLWHRCFPVNVAKFLRTPFSQNTSGRLLLSIQSCKTSSDITTITQEHAISKEQISRIPNRSIFSNLYTIWELSVNCTSKNNKIFVVSIDQEKAFGKVDREFLDIKNLGYVDKFINFIKTICKNTTFVISNSGFLSILYALSRGVQVECPLSLLYII